MHSTSLDTAKCCACRTSRHSTAKGPCRHEAPGSSGQYCSHLTLPFSTVLVIITTASVRCSHSMRQNAVEVSGLGPMAAMYHFGEPSNPGTKLALM